MESVFFAMNRDTDERKKRLLTALKETRGIVSVACTRAGVARRTFYQWLDSDEDFERSVEDVNEEAIDFAESKLLDNIEAGKERSIIFYLKTRGKKRGFREQGTGMNEMLSRELLTAFGNAYEAKASRFDTLEDMFGIEEHASVDTLLGVQSVQKSFLPQV